MTRSGVLSDLSTTGYLKDWYLKQMAIDSRALRVTSILPSFTDCQLLGFVDTLSSLSQCSHSPAELPIRLSSCAAMCPFLKSSSSMATLYTYLLSLVLTTSSSNRHGSPETTLITFCSAISLLAESLAMISCFLTCLNS